MDDNTYTIERMFATGVQVGCIKTLTELGLITENISAKQAWQKYGERQVKEWCLNGWVTRYPSGNKKRATYYFKRSELEIASRMIDGINLVRDNKIHLYQQSINQSIKNETSKTRKAVPSKF